MYALNGGKMQELLCCGKDGEGVELRDGGVPKVCCSVGEVGWSGYR